LSTIFHEIGNSLRQQGVLKTLRALLAYVPDLLFDRWYGIDTLRWEQLHGLTIVGPNRQHGVHYQPIRSNALKPLLSELRLPQDKVFMDIGCGKGKALILAAGQGFRRLAGVEFSRELCRIAERNLEIFAKRSDLVLDCRIINIDAAEYVIADDVGVIFMFNPFDDAVMAGFVTRLESAVMKNRDGLWVIYGYPLHDHILEASSCFTKLGKYEFAEIAFSVYKSIPAGSR
jgi:hypothetical protein